ncbi:MAG: hypothetical protein HY652_04690 [Acidobacteria bacterium]|nr:hypothetical protein [Acidobacteriota bacterium]
MRTKSGVLVQLVGAVLFIQGHNGFLQGQESGGANQRAWTSCGEFMAPEAGWNRKLYVQVHGGGRGVFVDMNLNGYPTFGRA